MLTANATRGDADAGQHLGLCMCDEGYDREDCGTCATGYQRDASGACVKRGALVRPALNASYGGGAFISSVFSTNFPDDKTTVDGWSHFTCNVGYPDVCTGQPPNPHNVNWLPHWHRVFFAGIESEFYDRGFLDGRHPGCTGCRVWRKTA